MSSLHPLPENVSRSSQPTNLRWLIFALACGTSWFLYLHRYTWNFVAPKLKEEFGWSDFQTQNVYSLFNVTYGLGQIPGGILCDFLGPHIFLVAIICLWSVALPLHGLAVNRATLAAVRLVFGLAQAGAFPILAKVSRTWFPLRYRTSVQAGIATFSGRGGGAMASVIMGTVLMGTWHLTWRESLWVMGSAGLLFAVLFAWFFRANPESDPRVNQAELHHIRDGEIAAARVSDGQFLSWSHALTSVSLWFLLCQQLLVAGVDTIFQTYMKQYFSGMGVSDKTAGWLVGLPLVGGAIGGTLAGFLNDAMLRGDRRGILRIAGLMGLILGGIVNLFLGGGLVIATNTDTFAWLMDFTGTLIRKSATGCLCGGLAGAIVGTVLMLFSGSRRWSRSVVGCTGVILASLMTVLVTSQTSALSAAATLFALKFFADMQQPTQWGACTDLGGRFSATIFGIVNTAGNAGGVLLPNLFGLINDANTSVVLSQGKEQKQINFVPLLLTAAVFYAIAAVCWLLVNPARSLDKARGEADRDA